MLTNHNLCHLIFARFFVHFFNLQLSPDCVELKYIGLRWCRVKNEVALLVEENLKCRILGFEKIGRGASAKSISDI